jgi:hypothetical protein
MGFRLHFCPPKSAHPVQSHTHAHAHTRVHTCTYTRTIYIYNYIHSIHMNAHACLNLYTHTHTHTHHAHTHIYTHIPMLTNFGYFFSQSGFSNVRPDPGAISESNVKTQLNCFWFIYELSYGPQEKELKSSN